MRRVSRAVIEKTVEGRKRHTSLFEPIPETLLGDGEVIGTPVPARGRPLLEHAKGPLHEHANKQEARRKRLFRMAGA